ncbi:BF3164 family lipoprotein [Bacteroides sp. 519]|uniref:BF3164 family lipoprotein n=1 Tax=Bacteroides sp. 519 TaxID=2302937 RepID=UPI0019403362|nr:BF3164 family lipoprotein [Bacteroides sp. 519]NDV58506.1 hypothetical protein [Bacteroides sp. 519]
MSIFKVFMMKNFIILLIFIGTICSCKTENTSLLLIDNFEKVKKLTLHEYNYPHDSLMKPSVIYSYGNYIVSSDLGSDYLLSVFNAETQSYVRFLKKGEGPEELLDIQQLGGYDDSVFVKSTFGKMLFIYSLKENLLSRVSIPENTVSLFLDDHLMITTNNGKSRYGIHNLNTKSSKEFGLTIPSQEELSCVLQGLCTGNAINDRIAWFSMYGDVFEIYDYSNMSEIKDIKQFVGAMPIVKMEGGAPIFSLDSKLGVPSVTSNNDYIFVLYSEKTLKDAVTLRDEVFLSNKILVLDWNGAFIEVLELNHPVRSISYNQEKEMLFCLGYDNEMNPKILFARKDEFIFD